MLIVWIINHLKMYHPPLPSYPISPPLLTLSTPPFSPRLPELNSVTSTMTNSVTLCKQFSTDSTEEYSHMDKQELVKFTPCKVNINTDIDVTP